MSVRLLVFSAPEFVDADQMIGHVTATTGSTKRLACAASGQPAPRIFWYRDGVSLAADSAREDIAMVDGRELTSSHLTLRGLLPGDSGRYRCEASNRRGTIGFTYHLLVLGQLSGSVNENMTDVM